MDVELLLSIVLAVSTVFYTIINLLMFFESRATRQQKVSPFVIAYLKTTENHNMLCVHIKNIGEGCAKNLKAKLLKDCNQFGDDKFPLSDCMIFKNGVNVFPPEYELKYYINSPDEIDYKSNDCYIELELEYSDMYGKRCKPCVFKLPFNQIGTNYSNPPESYLGQISYYLKELNKKIDKLK